MPRERKTVDVWEFWFDHGQGWECECIELTRKAMVENRKLYREAGSNPRIRKRRVARDKLATHDPQKP
jgi:hypothetical protein